jgi:hypothetical protein
MARMLPLTALASFSTRYLSILISALPFILAAAALEAALGRNRWLRSRRAISPAVDAAARGLNPVFIAGVLLVFGTTPAVAAILLVYVLAVVGLASGAERMVRPVPHPGDSHPGGGYLDEVVSVLYEMMRWTILSVLVAAALHFFLPELGLLGDGGLPAPLAAGVGLGLGSVLSIPYPAVPFAATLFFGLLPPAGLVAFVLAAVLLPANRLAGRITGAAPRSTIAIVVMVSAIFLASLPISSISFGVTL